MTLKRMWLPDEGYVWINPDHVTSVTRQSDGMVIIGLVGNSRPYAIVDGPIEDVVKALTT